MMRDTKCFADDCEKRVQSTTGTNYCSAECKHPDYAPKYWAARAELLKLRKLAEQAIRYHDDCGHEQYEDRRQCDPICTAAIAWRNSTEAKT